MFHTYIDWTHDERPFYVGMGDDARVSRRLGRNKHHTHTAKKHGLNRRIVASFEERQAAIDLEIRLIAEHYTFVDDISYNGIGCNYTRGGEGCPCSEETRKKISESRKGQPAWNKGLPGRKLTDEEKEHIAEKLRGSKNHMFGKPGTMSGKQHTDETRAKMRKPHLCSRCGEAGHQKRTCKSV